ncbi:MAG: hypothetical protein R8L58_04845 [Mariprofundaceae bacterium]
MKTSFKIVLSAALLMSLQPIVAPEAVAASWGKQQAVPDALYPVSPLIADKRVDTVYPSVAGDFLVYSKHAGSGDFNIVRVSKYSPQAGGRSIHPVVLNEAVRFGVAVSDGSMGYVSDRLGPVSAWLWQGKGDGHVAIANMATFSGGLIPEHLNASRDGSIWCFDSTFEHNRHNQLLNEFAKVSGGELLGQQWRIYDYNFYRHKQGYAATRTGNRNKFNPPVLFTFDRKSSQLAMINNALDGAVSPDGRRIAFVRESNGNYDIWMQDVQGGELVQLTNTPYGEFEPAWNADGSKLLFVSNRDSKGDVLKTSIYMMDMATSRIERLTNAARATDGGPAWLDEHTVVFHSNRDLKKPQAGTRSGWNIWQLKID